jgi:hypothetical protein
MGKHLILIGGAGPPGPAGSPGATGSAGTAPAILSTWISGVGVVFVPFGDGWQYYFTMVITPASGTVGIANLATITVETIGPGSATSILDTVILPGPFVIGTPIGTGSPVTVKTGIINTLDTTQGALIYTLQFQGANSAAATSAAYTTTVTVTPPVVTSATAVETGPRGQQPLQSGQPGGANTTSITVTPVLNLNPGGSLGSQNVTIWETHDWGDGKGQVTTWKGWWPVIGTSSAILLTGANLVFVTTLPASTPCVVTVRVFIGDVNSSLPIPAGAVTCTFTMAPIATLLATTILSASVLGISYAQTPGGYTWAWNGLQCSCPIDPAVTTGSLAFNPALYFGRFFLAKGAWNSGTQTWTPDPNYPEWGIGDTEDGTETMASTLVTTIASDPQPFPAFGDAYPTFRIRTIAVTRRNGDPGVAQTCWTGTEPTGAGINVVNQTGGSGGAGAAVYITPDQTKAHLVVPAAAAAPAILSTWISGLSIVFSPWGNLWDYCFTATIDPAALTVGIANLVSITVTTTGPGASATVQDQTIIPGPFVIGTPVVFTSGNINTLDPSQTPAPVYTLSFQGSNGVATSAAYTTTVTVTPPTITSPAVSEYLYPTPGSRVALANRGVTTTLLVTGTMVNNPAGAGVSQVTVWFDYDLSDGLGPRFFYEQAWPVAGNGAFSIQIPGVFIGLLASQTLTAKIFPGFLGNGALIPTTGSIATATFAFQGPATAASSWVTGAAFDTLKYGEGFFYWGALTYTAAFSTQAELKSTRCTVIWGSYVGGIFTADAGTSERSFTDADPSLSDPNATTYVSGNSVTVRLPATVAWPMPGPSPENAVQIRIYAQSPTLAWILQSPWPSGAGPAGITYATDHCIIQPDPTQTGAALAPAPVSIVLTAINSTSASTLAAIGGLPVWNATFLVTLATTSSNYFHTKALQIQVYGMGYQPFTVNAWTLSGATTSITIPTEYQDSSAHGESVTIVAINEDGVPSAQVLCATGIVIPAETPPFASTAPLAPTYASVTTTTPAAYYVPIGHDFNVGFNNIGFTTPSNSLGGNYSVLVNKLDPNGKRTPITTIPNLNAGGVVITPFISAAVDLLLAGNWIIELVPVNADGLTSGVHQQNVPVAPNIITPGTGVSGTEGTQFIEAGGGAQTHVNITTTITSTNAPGLSTGTPQTVTFYFSPDGTHWFWLGWVDLTASGTVQSFVLWRPTDVGYASCKAAAAIGAWNAPNGNPTFQSPGPVGFAASALPANAVTSSSTFALSLVGAPLSTSCTSAVVNARTATGTALYYGVTIGVSGGIPYWGLPNGFQCQDPALGSDVNYKSSAFHCYVVQTGTPGPGLGEVVATPDQDGVGENHTGALTGFGQVNLVTDVNGWPFNPTDGNNYQQLRIVNLAFSRSGLSTVQNSWPGTPSVGVAGPNTYITYHGTYCDVIFGPQPAPSIVVTLTPGQGISVSGLTISVKTPSIAANLLSNPGWESGTAGWTSQSANPTLNSTNQRSGSLCGQLAPNGAYCDQLVPFTGGVAAPVKAPGYLMSVGGTGVIQMFLRFLDGGLNIISQVTPITLSPTTTYQQMVLSGLCPSNAIWIALIWQTAAGSGYWVVDDCTVTSSAAITAGGLSFDGFGNLIINANSEFKFVNGQIQIAGVDFSKGFHGFTTDGTTIPQITITVAGTPLGWIGYDATSGYSGAWFKRVFIGGTSPANAPLFADAFGNVTIAGSLIVGPVANATNATTAGTATIYTGTLAVSNITGWSNSLITISAGVTFSGTAFAVRINVPNFTGYGPAALTANGPIVLSTDGVHPQIELSPATQGAGVAVVNSVTGDNVVIIAANNFPQLNINGTQVVGKQQVGPGNPSFTTFANVQTWAQALLTALRTHGLVT